MPRAKTSKKAPAIASGQNGVESNEVENATAKVILDKPKRVGKKSKDNPENPIASVEELVEVGNKKPKGRGAKKGKQNTEDLTEVPENATALVSVQNGVESNKDENATAKVILDKPKRVGKKTKDNAENPIASIEEQVEVGNEKSKKRGAKKGNQNTEDLTEAPENATALVSGQNGVEPNEVENATAKVVLDKPKRVGKKLKDNAENPIVSIEELDEVGIEKPKGRGAQKSKKNTEDLTEGPENVQAPKQTTKGTKKVSNIKNVVTEAIKSKGGRGNKKPKEEKNDNAIESNIAELPIISVNNVEQPPADVPAKEKSGRGVKQSKNLQNGNVQEEIPLTVKATPAPTKGRKKKEVIEALQNDTDVAAENTLQLKPKDIALSKDVKSKVTSKRGRTKKQQDVNDEPEVVSEKSPKKKAKTETSEPVKGSKRGKKIDKQNDIETTEETKEVAGKKDKASTSKEAAVAPKKLTGRKRTADTDVDNIGDNDETEETKPTKSKKALLNPVETSYNKSDFELSVSAVDGNISNVSSNGGEHQRTVLKISSWNVAGLRSWLKKDGLKYLDYEEPDIFCMQETKCTIDQMPEEAARIPGYHPYWLCLPGGYAGVALYSKIMPINVEYGIGNEDFDDAGRLITAEYEKFYLVNVYVPNSGRKLVNLEARMRWEKLFQAYVKKLDGLKPVIITGDMNVSHQEIDLANPKSNTRSAGFTIEEREKMTELLALGFVDTYRHLYPDKRGAYTYWTYMSNARARNVGWRLDYFLVSERILKRVAENAIRSQCMGSDHCPITLFINM